ncbi:hypothetical protein BT96DRAFT_1010233 [Gymnopus androsaceus JB14]|uniref:Uncharacterized protein n=1 Tax=Gymnopus androsaceus JB14 TaxID=1447944 RepID=A0A6A4GBC3_9AGAR|nr:hypothetical protein BT96DRAFT_1010233 [Gymnopus androsaceus JB14]
MSFNSDKIFRTRELEDFDQIQHLVECALLGLGAADNNPRIVPQTVQDHARAFMDFVTAFDRRVVACAARSSGSSKSVTSSSLTRKGSIPDDSSHRSLRSCSHRDAVQQPSTPTPSTRNLGGKTRTKSCSSSPTPASQVKENYLAAHPPTLDFNPFPKGSKLFRRFLSRSNSEGSPKSIISIPKGLLSSVFSLRMAALGWAKAHLANSLSMCIFSTFHICTYIVCRNSTGHSESSVSPPMPPLLLATHTASESLYSERIHVVSQVLRHFTAFFRRRSLCSMVLPCILTWDSTTEDMLYGRIFALLAST